jgi:hypothetical protein
MTQVCQWLILAKLKDLLPVCEAWILRIRCEHINAENLRIGSTFNLKVTKAI